MGRLIDLSHTIEPGRAGRKFDLRMVGAEEVNPDYYGTPDYGRAPRFEPEAIRWLVGAGMKMMGVDAGGVEAPGSAEHPNHQALFQSGIPLIENLAGLDRLRRSRVRVYAFPIAVRGLESFPVRVVAEEDEI